MFNFLKRKKEKELHDLDGNLLKIGDFVLSLRYDLGECKIIKTEEGIKYQSVETGQMVSWLKMIDASTERQKVKRKPDN
ncbi:MAG: hypothetical protein ABFS32_02205 [Bacteroidota bacterium]